ncbi:MAG: polyhydroxyalkanoate synthesis regulator phasin, partial [Glaciecola sp.]
AAELRMQRGVKAGKLSQAEATARLLAIRKSLGEEKKASDNKEGKKGKDLGAKYDAMKSRIDAAVKSGKITKDEGQERLTEFRRGLGKEKADAKADAKAKGKRRAKDKR